MKELAEKDHEKAIFWCQEFLKIFPKSYSMKCILAYTYRCINNYEQACKYLDEAINLKSKNPAAYYIYGEIYFRQEKYHQTINKLRHLDGDFKNLNLINLIVGVSYLFLINYKLALNYFDNVLQNDPDNYICLKYYVYIHEKKGNYLSALEILDKLLSINRD